MTETLLINCFEFWSFEFVSKFEFRALNFLNNYTLSSSSFCLPKSPEGLNIRVMIIARSATTI